MRFVIGTKKLLRESKFYDKDYCLDYPLQELNYVLLQSNLNPNMVYVVCEDQRIYETNCEEFNLKQLYNELKEKTKLRDFEMAKLSIYIKRYIRFGKENANKNLKEWEERMKDSNPNIKEILKQAEIITGPIENIRESRKYRNGVSTMKKFEIEIEEILQKVVAEEAETLEDALDKVYEKYHSGEIVLDYEDFKGEEIRAYGESKELEVRKDYVFSTSLGNVIVLEGNKNVAILKKLNDNENDENYVVVSGVSYNSKKEHLEWNHGNYFKNILEAIEFYDSRQENKIENEYIKEEGTIPNIRKIKIYNTLLDDVFEGRNYSEAIYMLKNYGLSNEEICSITSMKKEELNNILQDYEGEDECEY